MIDALREWIIALAAAAFIGGIAAALAPEGKMRRVVNLVSGFMLVAVMLAPVRRFELDDYARFLEEFRVQADEYRLEFENVPESDVKTIIEAKTAAYILDKTGITARVKARTVDGSEYPLPWEVELTAEYDVTASRLIESELGIPKERQKWVTR
ncbi:MAG: stage III sporulation protein AF [Oscillospiraceae bacterium]|jgi:stage III sporulation protein AF|nr:stage III sporulation protein AF [Oscillospiraceae bacterium]